MLAASAASALPRSKRLIRQNARRPPAAGSDHGNADGLANRRGQLAIETSSHAVGVHRGQPGTRPRRASSSSRAHSTTRRPASLRPPCTIDLRIAHRIGSLGIAPRRTGDGEDANGGVTESLLSAGGITRLAAAVRGSNDHRDGSRRDGHCCCRRVCMQAVHEISPLAARASFDDGDILELEPGHGDVLVRRSAGSGLFLLPGS